MEYQALSNVREQKMENGMIARVPGTGKVIGTYKRYQDARAAITRHKKKHPHAKGIYILPVLSQENK